jgi:phosphoglycolate phosphatase-like HAD superfamily hydrolase
MDYAAQLTGLSADHDFFIGFDSDGCVFDSMEIKHKECFCPAFVKHFHLQAVSKYAREAWEFVNLYSKSRGCNRFLAVTTAMDLLADRPEVAARGVTLHPLVKLREWQAVESALGNPALKARVAETRDPEFEMLLAWSLEVNERVADLVHGLAPFPGVREVIAAATGRADLLVVSQTPLEALEREWADAGIADTIRAIAGQEHGTKTEHQKLAATGKYAPEKILMIGDAPGDHKAAKANAALFFPIVPGREET